MNNAAPVKKHYWPRALPAMPEPGRFHNIGNFKDEIH
jgi:hypothetical protein